MRRKELFVNKLLKRLDRVDQQAISNYVHTLTRDHGYFYDCLHFIDEGIIILNADLSLYFVNDNAVEWTGIHPDSTKTNGRVLESIPDKDLGTWLSHQLKSLRDTVSEDFQTLIPKERRFQFRITSLKRDGEIKYLVVINPRQSAEFSTQRYSHMSALVKLAGGIAHEIGNPLNSIMIHLNLLAKQAEGLPKDIQKKLSKSLSAILSETARLDKIVRGFLKATRNPPLRFKVENINELVQETIDFMRPELKIHKISVELEPDESLPMCLLDKEKIHQAFINIIKNAMEAMPQGGKLSIRLSHKAKVVWIEFKDEGQGIAETDLPYIFDAYYTTKETGSGLGLMTVYNIIREHGGRIQVESTLKKGSTFTLMLPLRQPKLQLPEPTGD